MKLPLIVLWKGISASVASLLKSQGNNTLVVPRFTASLILIVCDLDTNYLGQYLADMHGCAWWYRDRGAKINDVGHMMEPSYAWEMNNKWCDRHMMKDVHREVITPRKGKNASLTLVKLRTSPIQTAFCLLITPKSISAPARLLCFHCLSCFWSHIFWKHCIVAMPYT